MNKSFLLSSFILVTLSTQAQYLTWQPKSYYADVLTGSTVTGTKRDGTGGGYAGPRMAYETFSFGDTLYATINDIQKFNVIGLSNAAVLSSDALASNTNVKYAILHGYDTPEFITWVENGIEGTHTSIGSILYLRIIYGTSIVYQTSSNGTLWATYRTAPTAPSGVYYIFVQLENSSVTSAFLNVRKNAATVSAPVNQRPVATAPTDQRLAYGVTATSVTGVSSDTDGAVTARLWSLISGPNNPTFVTPVADTTIMNGLISGTYAIKFKVTDDRNASAEDTMLIVVANPPSVVSGGSSGTRTFTPVNFPATDTDFIRPGASLEYWIYQSVIPYPTAASPSDNGMDRYDRFEWRSFENGASGTYNWTEFDNSIAAAISKNQKFSFGIMTLCTSCSDFATQEGGATLNSYPVYLHTLMQAEAENSKDWVNAGNWIPNYNSPNYLNRHKALLDALAAHIATSSYNGVPYSRVIRYIDVRGIGDYSEWHHNGYLENIPTGRFPTVATYKRVVDDYLAAFPDFQLVSLSDGYDPAGLSNTPPEVISYILNARNNAGKLGYRRDNIGSGKLWVHTKLENNPAVWNGVNLKDSIMTRWQTAPLVGEPMGCCSAEGGGSVYFDLERQVSFYHINSMGNGNIENPGSTETINAIRAAGKKMGHRYTITGGSTVDTIGTGSPFTISLNLKNDGNSPTYERWHITYELRNDTTNAVVWSAISPYNLKALLPSATATTITNGYTVPNTVLPGRYRLHLIIRDSSGYRKPYPLAISGRQSDGSYILADYITVLNGGTVNDTTNLAAIADQNMNLSKASVSMAGSSAKIENDRVSSARTNDPISSDKKLQVKILPNPSANYFQIYLTSNGKGPIRLCVTDMMGRVMEDRKTEGNMQQIKLGETWRNGIYVLELTQGRERKTIQLVKLR